MKNRVLEIGENESVWLREVVCILDADSATVQKTTRDFLKKNREKGFLTEPKGRVRMVNSFVITNAFGRDRVYQSPYTVGKLKKNAEAPLPGVKKQNA